MNTTVAGGRDHSLTLKQDGTVWAWGDNDYGQLGDGTTEDRSTPVQVSGLGGVTARLTSTPHRIAREMGAAITAQSLSCAFFDHLERDDVYAYATRCVAMERQWQIVLRAAEQGVHPPVWPESATAGQIFFWSCLPTAPEEGTHRAWRAMSHDERHAALVEGVLAVYRQALSSKI